MIWFFIRLCRAFSARLQRQQELTDTMRQQRMAGVTGVQAVGQQQLAAALIFRLNAAGSI